LPAKFEKMLGCFWSLLTGGGGGDDDDNQNDALTLRSHRSGISPWKKKKKKKKRKKKEHVGYTVEPLITDTAGEFKFCPL
jgi:hypothetical protein